MKKLKSIKEFSLNRENEKLSLSSNIFGGRAAEYTLTGCDDSYVCSPPCADCSDKDA